MIVQLEIPRERYGLIAELAERMRAHQHAFGKTALQKLVYFLQELFSVDCGYEFTLYNYGPFSSLLLSDLDAVSAFKGVEVEYYGHQTGYRISPGPKSSSVREHAKRFIGEHSDAIERVVTEFGGMWARHLELRATIVFAERDSRSTGKVLSPEELGSIVQGIKPHFSEEEIGEVIKELAGKKYIGVQRAKAAKLAKH